MAVNQEHALRSATTIHLETPEYTSGDLRGILVLVAGQELFLPFLAHAVHGDADGEAHV